MRLRRIKRSLLLVLVLGESLPVIYDNGGQRTFVGGAKEVAGARQEGYQEILGAFKGLRGVSENFTGLQGVQGALQRV